MCIRDRSIGYLFFLLLLGTTVWQSRGLARWHVEVRPKPEPEEQDKSNANNVLRWLSWAILASIGSIILIGSTNVLCQEIASHPFLWVLPLTMYLLSFIVAFEKPNWYRRRIVQVTFAVSVFSAILLFHLGTNAGLVFQLLGFASVTFLGTFVCHGELYRLRPSQESLTSFYLCIAAGGAMGGISTAFYAPVLFTGYFELHVGLLACLLFSGTIVAFEYFAKPKACLRKASCEVFILMVAALPVICSLTFYFDKNFRQDLLFQGRNHYGVVAVTEDDKFRRMINGQTHHGGQFVDSNRSGEPSAYYSAGSGVDVAFQIVRNRPKRRIGSGSNGETELEQNANGKRLPVGLDVGIIGLGTGAMLSYGLPDDRFRFYEINPMVETVARKYFDYLDNTNAEVVIGDGRIQIAKENDETGPYQFDLLFVDAFTSDSIPVHLITLECVDLYLKNLQRDGVLVFHITNQFVDLLPVIDSLASKNGLNKLLIDHKNDDFDIKTRWVLLSAQPLTESDKSNYQFRTEWPKNLRSVTWTDDKSALFPVVLWSSKLGRALK